MKPPSITFLLCLIILPQALGELGTSAGTERQLMGLVGEGFRVHLSFTGRLPVNWNELRQEIKLDELCDKYLGQSPSYIESRYQFITQPMSVPDRPGTQVVLARTVPVWSKDKSYLSRILIIQLRNGRFEALHVNEVLFQNMLHNSEIQIVRQPGLPAQEDEIRIKAQTPNPVQKESPAVLPSASIETPRSPSATPQLSEPLLEKPLPIMLISLVVAAVIASSIFLLRRKRQSQP